MTCSHKLRVMPPVCMQIFNLRNMLHNTRKQRKPTQRNKILLLVVIFNPVKACVIMILILLNAHFVMADLTYQLFGLRVLFICLLVLRPMKYIIFWLCYFSMFHRLSFRRHFVKITEKTDEQSYCICN